MVRNPYQTRCRATQARWRTSITPPPTVKPTASVLTVTVSFSDSSNLSHETHSFSPKLIANLDVGKKQRENKKKKKKDENTILVLAF